MSTHVLTSPVKPAAAHKADRPSFFKRMARKFIESRMRAAERAILASDYRMAAEIRVMRDRAGL